MANPTGSRTGWQTKRSVALGGSAHPRRVDFKRIGGVLLSIWRDAGIWRWARETSGERREGTAPTRVQAERLAVWA